MAPQLAVDSPTATAGFFRLSWGPGASEFELQEADGPGFERPTTLYRGPDTATVISGRWMDRAPVGQTAAQAPQPVHLSSSTYRAFRRTVTLKSPAWPSTLSTWL